jgi:hypothetical protein
VWLKVPCNAALAYRSKGRRDKRFPLWEELRPFWDLLDEGRKQGLLFERRAMLAGKEPAPWRGASLAELVSGYQRRCAARPPASAAERLQLRDHLLRQAGGLNYDHIQSEFQRLARALQWPPQRDAQRSAASLCDHPEQRSDAGRVSPIPDGPVQPGAFIVASPSDSSVLGVASEDLLPGLIKLRHTPRLGGRDPGQGLAGEGLELVADRPCAKKCAAITVQIDD